MREKREKERERVRASLRLLLNREELRGVREGERESQSKFALLLDREELRNQNESQFSFIHELFDPVKAFLHHSFVRRTSQEVRSRRFRKGSRRSSQTVVLLYI